MVAVVTARGASKGIPGKNLRLLCGNPLIAWTIKAALRSSRLSRVLVSTDSEAIAQAARLAGRDQSSQGPLELEIPFLRPSHLATDTATHLDVIRHALTWLNSQDDLPEYVLTLQPTSPLRTTSDIDAAVELALTRRADAVVSVSPLEHHPSLFRIIGQNEELVPFLADDAPNTRRQDFEPVHMINGAIYDNRTQALLASGLFCPPGALAYPMPAERALDIDEPWHLTVAEALLTKALS